MKQTTIDHIIILSNEIGKCEAIIEHQRERIDALTCEIDRLVRQAQLEHKGEAE